MIQPLKFYHCELRDSLKIKILYRKLTCGQRGLARLAKWESEPAYRSWIISLGLGFPTLATMMQTMEPLHAATLLTAVTKSCAAIIEKMPLILTFDEAMILIALAPEGSKFMRMLSAATMPTVCE